MTPPSPGTRPYGVAPSGYRLPDDTRVGAVHLQVSDLARSIAYYEQVIGFRLYNQTTESATLGPHNDRQPLLHLRTAPGVGPARRGALGLYHFAILLPDRVSFALFAAHVARLSLRVGMADHLVSEAFYLWDPDGLGIEVYADRPRNAWQQHGRELVMTTESLDVGGLLSAAGDGHWTGLPAGTTIGHMHLHVGSLEEAEAFYHAALGFDKMVWSYPGALFLSAGGYHHHLGTNVWSSGPSPAGGEAQLFGWEVIVPSDRDVGEVGDSARRAGYRIEASPRGIALADPWGTRLRIVT